MSILAIDIATVTGWASCSPIRSGSVAFPGDLGEFCWNFENWLQASIEKFRPIMLAIEQPIVVHGKTNFSTTSRLVGAYAIARKVAYDHELETIEATPSQWRKHFIGRGSAPLGVLNKRKWLKAAVIDECCRRGWNPTDDNAADALGLLSYAMEASRG